MGKKPDFRLKIMDKDTGEKCNDAGVGWKNDDDSISIVIAPGVVLQRKTNLVITLFPILLNNMKGII